jgi:hydrogenase/urease accessory protein HupE
MRAALLAIAVLLCPAIGWAHPAPFSYADLYFTNDAIDGAIVLHVYDLAHDLRIDPAERLLDPTTAQAQRAALESLLRARLQLAADGRPLASELGGIDVLTDRSSLRLRMRWPFSRAPGRLTLTALLFPYDPNHQTFVNVYERGSLTSQAILDARRSSYDYFAGSRQGTWAVVRRFLPAGVHHILIGPDHLLFLVGLLLLGGTLRQLTVIVTAFTAAHSITLALAVLDIVNPPARLIEPAIALSIIYVGADNLLAGKGRDMRALVAFVFGFVHGFGFAGVLKEMDLPARALGWSLVSFNVGVEIGQLAVVVVVASALAMVRSRHESAGRRLVFAGSIAVILAGSYWFVQRVFFPGGIS